MGAIVFAVMVGFFANALGARFALERGYFWWGLVMILLAASCFIAGAALVWGR